MVEVSEVFQQPKFQSLCHDLLFHCRFLFVFCLWYFKQTVKLIIYSFFMFYSMVNKCMTQWQKFSVFWQQAGHVEIYIVLINTTKQRKFAAEIVVEKSSICVWQKVSSRNRSSHPEVFLKKGVLKIHSKFKLLI